MQRIKPWNIKDQNIMLSFFVIKATMSKARGIKEKYKL